MVSIVVVVLVPAVCFDYSEAIVMGLMGETEGDTFSYFFFSFGGASKLTKIRYVFIFHHTYSFELSLANHEINEELRKKLLKTRFWWLVLVLAPFIKNDRFRFHFSCSIRAVDYLYLFLLEINLVVCQSLPRSLGCHLRISAIF